MPAKKNDPKLPLNSDQLRQLLWLILVMITIVWIINAVIIAPVQVKQVPYSEFKSMVQQQAFEEVIVGTHAVRGNIKASESQPAQSYEAVKVNDPDLIKDLAASGTRYRGELESTWGSFFLVWVLSFIFMYFLWRFLLGRAGGGGNNLMTVGRSKAKVYMERDIGVTFDDVAGVDEAKEELREIIDFLREPEKYRRLGGKIPKGCCWWVRRAPARPCSPRP